MFLSKLGQRISLFLGMFSVGGLMILKMKSSHNTIMHSTINRIVFFIDKASEAIIEIYDTTEGEL